MHTLQLEFQQNKSLKSERYFNIETGTLLTGSTTITVCPELVSILSPVLCASFYGGFIEKGLHVVECKDVDEESFVWFINCIHSNSWDSLTVGRAIYAVVFIDRYAMLTLYKKIFPYLMKVEISDELRSEAIIAADKMPEGCLLIVRI
ncbi:hypothetical protein PENTCL1PPCAC_19551, partial [Pristionchus entomophagus]